MLLSLILSLASLAVAQAGVKCEGDFQDITAEEWVKKINPGMLKEVAHIQGIC
jgi:hypothetical protein